MEISGVPLHPLVVHAAVVFTPLAAAFVIAFAVMPRWRWATRWPAAVLTGTALVAVFVARLSGEALVEDHPSLAKAVETHEERADVLFLLLIVFTVLVAVGVWALSGPSGLASGRGAREVRMAVLERTLPVALVAAAALVLVWVVLTGDAGARAVWRADQ